MKVEWIVLADAAEVVQGKLYMMGGGWEQIGLATAPPVRHNFAIAVAFEIPYNETNEPHDLRLVVEDPDAIELFRAEGQVEAGRPAGINPGASQRVQLAFSVGHDFAKPGPYVVRAQVDGADGQDTERSKEVRFQVTVPQHLRQSDT